MHMDVQVPGKSQGWSILIKSNDFLNCQRLAVYFEWHHYCPAPYAMPPRPQVGDTKRI